MSAHIIDGRKIASEKEAILKKKIEELDRPPRLDTILAGEDEGSKVYLGTKDKGCKRVGIDSVTHRYEDTVTESELIDKIRSMNEDDAVDGILLQMPLPKGIDTNRLISEIDPIKDVEGMHPVNLGSLIAGTEVRVPCTPKGILTMLDHEEVELKGTEVCIVSHSMIVGKPMAILLLNRNTTVTVVHEFTENLSEHTSRADVLISAAGVPHLLSADMLKENAVVIDVGMNRLESGELVGDVNFEDAKKIVAKITPVPGGVGPTTVLSLLENTYDAYVKLLP